MAKPYGLTKNEIIRRPQDFSAIFEHGRFLRGRWFDIAYRRGERRQVAFAAAKRVRTAVSRNRIKRMLREAYRIEKESFPAAAQVVLIGQENILQTHLADLRNEMRKMATRIHVKP
jgi:ribonuclease P protein component